MEKNLQINNSPLNNKSSSINKNSFQFMYVIGKGGFGKVWKVQYKKTKETYALKEMSKLKIINKKSEKSINSEREFLSILNHPFIVNMHYAFQDRDNLYLIMDMLSGGDLRYHISRYRRFSEEQTRFFIACMIYTLEYIHSNNVIHRDIKPENLVLDNKGYVRITDFGIAKENMIDNSSETSGTPGYMSPEVMRGKNHSFPVDYFAIGVIGYEFMMGKRPYYGKNRKEIKDQMISVQACIKNDDLRQGWSPESADFINKLLIRKADDRLGSKFGTFEMKEHPWLKYYPWKELENKSLPAPFVPEKKDNFDKRYCESIDKIGEETKMRYEEILEGESYKNSFKKFYYNKDEVEYKKKLEKKIKNEESDNNKILKDKVIITTNSTNNNNINIINNISPSNTINKQSSNSTRIPNSKNEKNSSQTTRPVSTTKKRQLSHSNSSIAILSNQNNNNINKNQNVDNEEKRKIKNELNNNHFEKYNNNLNHYNKNKSSVNIFNNINNKNRLIQKVNQESQNKNFINGIINGYLRSSSVINKKNGGKVTNHSHKININYPRTKNNSGNNSKNIYGNKKLNRVNSSSKMLSRSSTDLIFNKSNNISLYNKNNFNNYNSNIFHFNYVK